MYICYKFTILNILSAVVWTAVVGFGSYFFGNAIEKAYNFVAAKPYIALIVVGVIVALIWLYLSTATKKKNK